jgi:hypothetical protein
VKIQSVAFEDDEIRVSFDTGETVGVPLDFFADLAAATPAQRAKWSLIGSGIGVHWPAIDADISVENFLAASSRARLTQYA